MLGLFSTLNLGQRALQTQQQAIEVTGHNLSNVNNPAYSRQRLQVETTPDLQTMIGPEGTGVTAAAIRQVRSSLLDNQITQENSQTESLTAQQQVLEQIQADLGEQIDTKTTGADATASAANSQNPNSLGQSIDNLFNSFQSLSTQPTSSAERTNLVQSAQSLAQQFNQIQSRLDNVRQSIHTAMSDDVGSANQLLQQIAQLNQQIMTAENGSPGSANDLRDARQAKIESLAKLVKVDVTNQSNGMVGISVDGQQLVSGTQVTDSLALTDPGNGRWTLETQSSQTPLSPGGGSLGGRIQARDGELQKLDDGLNSLAAQLIQRVNQTHRNGYSLTGSTGADFFTGTDAATIAVNPDLLNNPSLVQAAGQPNAPGDNQTILALAQLGNAKVSGLNGQTFHEDYTQLAAGLGSSLQSTNQQLDNQKLVDNMLQQQRNSVSGVSIDEEMTNMMTYQRAYEASARLITTVDQMIQTVLAMKQ